MGAAGFVNVYKLDEVKTKFEELYPSYNIFDDWWYLKTITINLDGTNYIFDYSDDQGYHEGSNNDFWFGDEEAQGRVKESLRNLKFNECVEVWT